MTPFFIHLQALTVGKTVNKFLGKKAIWTAHYTFLESKHPKDTENFYYGLFPQVSRKS